VNFSTGYSNGGNGELGKRGNDVCRQKAGIGEAIMTLDLLV